jgi:hypothetical protein
MAAASLPLQEKIKIYGFSLLLTLTIYVIIDLYVPARDFLAGNPMTFEQVMAHLQLGKKLPFILIITVLMAIRNIKKKNQALAAEPADETPRADALKTS